MNSGWSKRLGWAVALAAYILTVAIVYAELPGLSDMEILDKFAGKGEWRQEQGRRILRIADVGLDELKGALLLPTGLESPLPGRPEIWDELVRSASGRQLAKKSDGFVAIQAPSLPAEFTEGWITELFLGGRTPLQVLRYGSHLFVLTSSNIVQVVACEDPLQPRLVGTLPYARVKKMGLQGDRLFLLLDGKKGDISQLVTLDIASPAAPPELERRFLPRSTHTFFIDGEHLALLTRGEFLKDARFRTNDLLITFYLNDASFNKPLSEAPVPWVDSVFVRHGDFLITPGRTGLNVVDLRDRTLPKLAATLTLSGSVRHMALFNDRLYALSSKRIIHIIDLSDPLYPHETGTVAEAKGAAMVSIIDNAIYFFSRNGYLRAYGCSSAPGEKCADLLQSMADGAPASLGDIENIKSPRPSDDPSLQSRNTGISMPEDGASGPVLDRGNLRLKLTDDGLLQSYQRSPDDELLPVGRLKLPPGQRWLAGSAQRVYVGGGGEILIIDPREDGQLALAGRLELPVAATWDAAVSGQTLWVASGRGGMLAFSLVNPDRPAGPDRPLLHHLAGQADIRQIAVGPGDRVCAAAGLAGLLCFRQTADGRASLSGRLDFAEPVSAVGMVDGLCLVASETRVHVVDVGVADSMQKLGHMAVPRVERFAPAPRQHWAARVRGQGWINLPLPRHLTLEKWVDSDGVQLTFPQDLPRGDYRVVLYNDAGVKVLPGRHRHLVSSVDRSMVESHDDD